MTNALEAVRLDPNDSYGYQNLADAYERLGRYDEAKAILDQTKTRKLNTDIDSFTRFDLAFMRGDEAGMQAAVAKAKGGPFEPIIFLIKADSECAEGKIQKARQSSSEGVGSAQKSGQKELSAGLRALQAACEVEVGNRSLAQKQALEVLALSDDPSVRGLAALALARAGDTSRSQKLIEQVAKESPTNTLISAVWMPTARAANQIQAGQPAQAVATLQAATPYEFGSPPEGAQYWPIHIRGDAYLHLGDGAKAAVEYQKILDHRGINPTSPLYSLARLGSARAYALQGDKAKAKTAYQDFFAAWKDADPDVPILKEAKAEYAKLQ